MLSLPTGIARSESEVEVKHEGVSELRLQLRLQPVLLLRRLIAANGAKAAREALAPAAPDLHAASGTSVQGWIGASKRCGSKSGTEGLTGRL